MDPAAKRQRLNGSSAPSADSHGAGTEVEQSEQYPLQNVEAQREPDQIEGLPQGWCNCPSMGDKIGYFVPCKTPLGARHMRKIPQGCEFTPGMLVEMAYERWNQHVGMVIDLTNTKRYYDALDWQELGVAYVKMPCRGRGQTPEEATVNYFMWEAMRFSQDHPDLLIAVHCTHGFNRTGFMIANYIMRVGINVQFKDNTLEEALSKFARARKPGIYKDHYINTLYEVHHMHRPSALRTPPVPQWKGDDSPPNSPEAEAPQEQGKPNEEWQHDDPLGEPIHEDMANILRSQVMEMCRGYPPGNGRMMFPGSQPVSLDRTNLSFLQERRYYVTWKADGTRYMLLLRADGTYLIDRAFRVTRVEMRFPTKEMTPHHFTLLDGEMVVDEDITTGVRTRRFLIYDLMMSQSQSYIQRSFGDRFKAIHDELIHPRNIDKQHVLQHKVNYNYGLELFSSRRKDFWQLHTSEKVLNSVISNLTHESDGLIFQSWVDPYVSGTCNELLKWKFASHNSVDFLLQMNDNGEPDLYLKGSMRGQRGNVKLEGGRIVFPDGDDPRDWNNQIVECRYLKDSGDWEFMRNRTDKKTANAYHVYEKVLKSIQDNITQEILLQHVKEVVETAPMYDEERKDMESRRKRDQQRAAAGSSRR